MNFCFHESAENEFLLAIEYYESQQPGLGLQFSREVYASITRICEHPLAWEMLDNELRRCITGRFPYGLIYRIVADSIQIIAVMHLNREPGYFRGRE
ncbi:MAG TPA: type II toxin-antitoxin system RelE/ParE family toxin [Spirochaetota bacterium]|nr:type II toxin-antitoxin system RelE/ParE family toxin [Spirochaetota bacterium]